MTDNPEHSVPYWVGYLDMLLYLAMSGGEEAIPLDKVRRVHDGLVATTGLDPSVLMSNAAVPS